VGSASRWAGSRIPTATSTRSSAASRDHATANVKYLLLCCIEEARWETLPESQRAEIVRGDDQLMGQVARSGRHLAGARLRGSATATTVRRRNGRLVIADGPFAATDEQVGGCHLVECENLDEAIAIAARLPSLRAGGSIEVRPVLEEP
jgi:hypothetical protein